MKKNSHKNPLSFKAAFTVALITGFSLFSSFSANAQITSTVKRVMLQGFWWDYWNSNYRFGWANYLTELAPRIKALGFDAIWIPPSAKCNSAGSVGYSPFDMYDLGDKYQKEQGDTTRSGTKDELLRMIAVLHANGIEVIEDMVINHNSDANAVGGVDNTNALSLASASGYKNFRYVSYKSPALDNSANDYYTRSGRWAKNWQNFHPNSAHNCNSGDICSSFWGPDLCYDVTGSTGQSGSMPTFAATVTVAGVVRTYHNPVQPSNYMFTSGRDYMAWFKKQTACDGFRFDAVKHYSIAAQNDFITNVKYNVPAFAQGGQDMMSVGEWVGSQFDVDNYVSAVASGGEEHTGTYDFAFRGYSTNGSGLYGLVLGNGGYDMQNIYNCQQSKRYYDYNGGTKRVYRSVNFVNSHDTYRPFLDSVGNFKKALGDASGWDGGNELGGNGQHIDPREPRLAAGYAAAFAVDGNPAVYFEDIFDIGTTGKRWSHLPTNETDLPIRADIRNIMHAHQKLGFKDGAYGVPTAPGQGAVYNAGNSGDHVVLERKGKALIGITDNYSTDQDVTVTVGDPSWYNKALIDYSGSHGLTTTTVSGTGRVSIKTSRNGHNISGAYGHGYSIWAPLPTGVTFATVTDMYNYLATYTPPRSTKTTQEWEMADDLGDSHCKSLGQGGALPNLATNERIAGKIFAAKDSAISCVVSPEVDGRNLTLTLYNTSGDILATASGISTVAAPLTLNYTPGADGWVVAKVRNTLETNASQKCWVRLAYTAPKTVDTKSTTHQFPTSVSIWTGNKGTTNMADCANWEGGLVPGTASHVIVYGHAKPYPVADVNITVNKVSLRGGNLTVNNGITVTVLSQ